MTEPGLVYPPQPGWWPRTEAVGVSLTSTYGWASTATGASAAQGTASGTYGWAADAHGVAPVLAFDTVGTNGGSASGTTLSISILPTALAYVLVDINVGSNVTITQCNYGSTAMTALGGQSFYNTPASGWIYRFGINYVPNPGGVAQTISIASSASTSMWAGALSYRGVTTVGTLQTVSGGSTSLSQAVTCGSNQMIVQSFALVAAGSLSTVSGGTPRYNSVLSGSGNIVAATDSTSSTTFSVTTGASHDWAGIATVFS